MCTVVVIVNEFISIASLNLPKQYSLNYANTFYGETGIKPHVFEFKNLLSSQALFA